MIHNIKIVHDKRVCGRANLVRAPGTCHRSFAAPFCALICAFCCTFLRGHCHEMDFFEGLNKWISTVCICADGFQSLSKAFHYPIQLLTFYLLPWNYLLILKMLTETLLRISSSVIGRCSLVPSSHWLQGKCTRFILSLAAFGIILQNRKRLPVGIFSVKNAALVSLKRVTGRIFKIGK